MDFETIYRTCAADVRRALRTLGVMEKDLPDAAHEVFVVVHRRLSTFEERSALRTWVIGITRRVAADYRRRASTRLEVLEESPSPGWAAMTEVDALLEARDARDAIELALLKLDSAKRKVVAGYALDEQPMARVARELRVPLQTAYARLYAAHRQLRELLSSGPAPAHEPVRRLYPPVYQ